MRRLFLKLVWLSSCALTVVVYATPPAPPPRVVPTATPVVDWMPLRDALDARDRWYEWASLLPPPKPRRPAPQTVFGTGACGGSLPPCSVLRCESGGNLRARNPSGASGKWQFMSGTWAGFGGYAEAADAPEEVQDARAREVWNGGRGAGNWVCK